MIHSLESVIRAHTFFHGLEERYIAFIAGCAKNAVFGVSQYILREGDPADQFYFIRQGLVSVEIMIPQQGPVTVQTLAEGDMLGWSWLAPPYRWHFDARAVEETRALAFDGKCLRNKCDEDHDLGYEIMKRFTHVVSQRLDSTRLQLLDLYGVHI